MVSCRGLWNWTCWCRSTGMMMAIEEPPSSPVGNNSRDSQGEQATDASQKATAAADERWSTYPWDEQVEGRRWQVKCAVLSKGGASKQLRSVGLDRGKRVIQLDPYCRAWSIPILHSLGTCCSAKECQMQAGLNMDPQLQDARSGASLRLAVQTNTFTLKVWQTNTVPPLWLCVSINDVNTESMVVIWFSFSLPLVTKPNMSCLMATPRGHITFCVLCWRAF